MQILTGRYLLFPFWESERRLALPASVLLTTCLFLTACTDDPTLPQLDSEQLTIGKYLHVHMDLYSEFRQLMESTGLESLLNTRGPFTLFLPTDKAMEEFYVRNELNSLEDLSGEEQNELILNHIIGAGIQTLEIGLGTLREKNALGDHVVSEFDAADIIINKHARIIIRDIRTSNGFIHVIDHAMEPIKDDIYAVVSSDPSFRIFSDGLKMTGLKDTLQLISFPYGQWEARTRFTLLAVPDTLYHRHGIQSADDLVTWCGADPDSLRCKSDPFYRYFDYHCLSGTHYLSEWETGIYPVLSGDNHISMTVDTDYKINCDPHTDAYTGLHIRASNFPARNGVLHTLDGILPVTPPEPVPYCFETTDFLDLKVRVYYQNHYARFHDGENTFEKIKWKGDYLLYFFRKEKVIAKTLRNSDCLSMQGWWTISITFPKVRKGNYEVYIYQPEWWNVTDCIAYIDGVKTPYIYKGPYGDHEGKGGLQKIAEVYFETTSEHTITLRNTANGILFWDYVKFVPVN